MSRYTFAAVVRSVMGAARLLGFAFLLSLGSAYAQVSRTITDGYTPTGLAPGAPAGSYALSGLDNINLFSGKLNFRVPLLTVGGRGAAGYTITLPIEKNWYVYRYYPPPATDPDYYLQEALYNYGYNDKVGYGPGVLITRRASSSGQTESSCGSSGFAFVSLTTRMVFAAPDGTQYELYDQEYNGDPYTVNLCSFPLGARNRRRVFASDDGKSMTFVSDTDIIDHPVSFTEDSYPTGNLMMRDGAMCRIVNGKVQWIRDRNGNKVSFTYVGPDDWRVSTITDPLNRRVTISYNDQLPSYDAITFSGHGGATRTIKIWHDAVGNVMRSGDVAQKANQLFPQIYAGQTTWTGDWYYNSEAVVSSVELPNGLRYYFYYNSYGELARVILPTGGGYDYDYVGASPIPNGGSVFGLAVYRRLTRRTVYNTLTSTTDPDNPPAGAAEEKAVYSVYSNPYQESELNYTTVTVERRAPSPAPDGALLEAEKHYFYGHPTFGMFGNCPPDSSPGWIAGKEFKAEFYEVTGGEMGGVRRRVEHTWYPYVTGAVLNVCSSGPAPAPRIIETVTTLADTNQVSKQTFAHDQYNNVTDIRDYGFGVGAPGPLIRRAHTSYLTTNGNQGDANYAADVNIHIRNLPVQKVVYDESGNVRSQTDFIYDYYGDFPLVERPGIVQHDGGFHAGYGARGNLTGVTLRNPGGSPSEVHLHSQYDIAGNLVKAVDGRGYQTDFEYADRFGSPDGDARSNAGAPELAGGFSYAFPTHVTDALGHQAYTKYDYYLGKAVDAEDVNGVVSCWYYNDSLERLTQIVSAVNDSTSKKQTTFTYNDTSHIITTSSDLSAYGDNSLKKEIVYDGLGRTTESRSYEDATHYILTSTQYDALGRPHKVSYPYRPNDTVNWAITSYDSLGRVVSVTTPDDAVVTTSYYGNLVTVTDQSGNTRRSETDELGRLKRVVEDPAALNYVTDYSYDALGNLSQVTQGAQTRTFTYDLLSRLVSTTNPENGATTYSYDPNGNLTQKTDARGVTATMTYDKLNRITSKTYSGDTPGATAIANATPSVNYFYDNYSTLPGGAPTISGGRPVGRLIGVTYGGGSQGAYYKYDAVGRISASYQRQDATNYQTAYKYNLAGNVTTETRSDKRKTFFYYDQAARLTGLQTESYPYLALDNIVAGIQYTPFGAVQQETYGNGLLHTLDYNIRRQPMRIWLGRPGTPGSVARIDYIFGLVDDVNQDDPYIHAYYNNGNVGRIKYYLNGALQQSQTFQYDGVNRLRYAVEHNNGNYTDAARAWYQTFAYDQYGNRGIDVANTSDNVDASNGALQLSEFDAANNRIRRSGFDYDAAGNLVAESGKSYAYDAENRIVSATAQGGTSQYVYDGDGRRVKKTVNGVGASFEYGAGGELLTERNDSGAPVKDYLYRNGELIATSEDGTTYKYATSDHLGSPRIWTDTSGNVVAGGRHDYLPFGEELFAGVGARTTAWITSAQDTLPVCKAGLQALIRFWRVADFSFHRVGIAILTY
jgi:YD repeat-containing protein